jgi:hypothetical protein
MNIATEETAPSPADVKDVQPTPRPGAEPIAGEGGEGEGEKTPRQVRMEKRKAGGRNDGLERAFKLIGEQKHMIKELNDNVSRLLGHTESRSAAEDVEPDLESFDDRKEGAKAWAAWNVRDEARREKITKDATEAAERAKNGGKKPGESGERPPQAKVLAELTGANYDICEDFVDQQAEARTRHKDFDAVITKPDLKFTALLARCIVESEHGAEVQYLLGNEPEEVTRLSSINSLREMTAEIEKLETQIQEQVGGDDEEPPSGAPTSREPIDRPGTSRSSVRKSESKMTDKEWFVERERLERQKRKR